MLADSPHRRRHRAVQRLQHRRAIARDLRGLVENATRAPIASPARARPTCGRPSSITSARKAQIMIATEAGAEGINLQFCSLVVNYDLPWNPQRIEQRIGRCHRYGQKHDVVVVNFLNRKQRGRSARLPSCWRRSSRSSKASSAPATRCSARSSRASTSRSVSRTSTSGAAHPEEIKASFDQLQLELGLQINDAMTRTASNCWRTLTPKFTTSCGSASTKAVTTSTATNGC